MLTNPLLLCPQGEDEPPQEPDTDLGHADVPPAHPPPHPPLNHHAGQGAGHERHLLHLPGPLERVRETAVHAVQDVKHRLHLDGGEPTAEQRTGGWVWGGGDGWNGCG